MENKKSRKGLVIVLLIAAILIAVIPFLALKDAEFGGSDDAGSQMVSEIQGEEHTPWAASMREANGKKRMEKVKNRDTGR